jgi:DNA end-binding protein Ku
MRAMWSGAVSFGLVSVPVKLYSATASHDIRFHQVHAADGGRIRYKRVCTVCGNEVDYADIVKGYETEDGELITLDEADLDSLPVAGGSHEIDVVEFVPADQVDPLLFEKSYYLEPETKAAKPYALLREALRQADRMALVKVALRQRETLALLRVRDKVIVLQTMLWPDEVREPDFDILDAEIDLRPQEMQMAASLVDSLTADFDPTRFSDEYLTAVQDLIERKRSTGETRPTPAPAAAGGDGADSMTDLLTALQRSVDAAKANSGSDNSAPSVPRQRGSGSENSAGSSKPAGSSKAGAKSSKSKSTAKKAGTNDGETKSARRSRRPA